MQHLSTERLAEVVHQRRSSKKMSQAELSEKTGINRSLISRLESGEFSPSVEQLLALSEALGFELKEVLAGNEHEDMPLKRMRVAVAGTGYVGLSLSVLLSQRHDVTAVDIIPGKVELLRSWRSPIQDEYIEKFLKEHEKRGLSLQATTEARQAYASADYIIIAAPTNYDPKANFFDCSAVESVLALIREATADRMKKPTVVIKSTIPVGYTAQIREKTGMDNVIFSPEFLRESKALYDNLYPSRIIVGADDGNRGAAETFAEMLRQCAVKKDTPVLLMSSTEAEATKLFVSTYLALRVS